MQDRIREFRPILGFSIGVFGLETAIGKKNFERIDVSLEILSNLWTKRANILSSN